jgi:hypothetical protein
MNLEFRRKNARTQKPMPSTSSTNRTQQDSSEDGRTFTEIEKAHFAADDV